MSSRPAANRMTLQTFKAKLGGASKGFKLLKKKRDALKSKFMALLKELVDTKMSSCKGLQEAAFSLAQANWAMAGDDLNSTVVQRAAKPTVTVKLSQENCAGVSIPKFEMLHDPSKDTSAETIGITNGGAVVSSCKKTYFKAIEDLVRLASLQCAFHTLDQEIKMTSRRVNALQYVLIPRIEDTIKYVTSEMDEMDREEFFRVKKVVEKKKAKIEREKNALKKELAAKGLKAPEPVSAMDAPSAVGNKDADIIF
jgi:V-type H+-transporting ATPase subunit D